MARSRREVKLPYREIHITCPHCRAPLVIGTVMDAILMSRRTCPRMTCRRNLAGLRKNQASQ